MNIADQLITIAENEQKVYDAGYNKGVDAGYNDGVASGYENGYEEGLTEGYEKGKTEGGIDWSNTTNFRYFSYNNNRNHLVEKLKYNDTSNGTDFYEFLRNCSELTEVPELDYSSATTMYSAFWGCSSLTELGVINSSKASSFNTTFSGCSNLRTIKGFDISSCSQSSISSAFNNCNELRNITFLGTLKITRNFSVFSSSHAPNITPETIVSFLNCLSDNTGVATTYKISIGSTNLAKLTDEQKQIAYDKNYTLA